MDQPDRIHLRDYVLSAEIGAFQTERGVTQRLRFNLTVDLAAPVAGAGDDVDRILSYDVLTDAVHAGLADERLNLLETLAEKIAAEVLCHPAAARITVCIEKLDRVPGALGITITRSSAGGTSGAGAEAITPLVLHWGAEAVLPAGAVIVTPPAPGLPLPPGGDRRRIALLALDQAAWALAGRSGLIVADSRTELDWAVGVGRAVVWAPARMAADVPELAADPLALSFWLAARMNAQALIVALPADHALPVPPAGFRPKLLRA